MYLRVHMVDLRFLPVDAFRNLVRDEGSICQRWHFPGDLLCRIGHDWNIREAIEGRDVAHTCDAALPGFLDELVLDQFLEELVNG